MNKRSHYRLIIVVFLFLSVIQANSAQSENTFVSYTGGFSINLPNKTNGISGIGSSNGIKFSWDLNQIKYEVGFSEKAGLALALKSGDFSFNDYEKQYLNPYSQNGEKINEREISLQGYNGKEFKFSNDKTITIARIFKVDDRIYSVYAEFAQAKTPDEKRVLQVFDTFRLLDKENVRSLMQKKLDDATPKSLPQTPAAAKLRSDIDDKGFNGKVRSVSIESATYNLAKQVVSPKPTLFEEFNEEGNLIKSIEYNHYGDASVVKTYGYLNGKRVSRRNRISYDYDFYVGWIQADSPRSAKFDTRFDESFTYKYLNNRLIEENKYFNNGIRESLIKYIYSKNKKEHNYYFGSDAIPTHKIEEIFDENGNAIKFTRFERKGKRYVAEEPYELKYISFDEFGNWTKRTISKWYGVGNQGKYLPHYDEVRTINYYN